MTLLTIMAGICCVVTLFMWMWCYTTSYYRSLWEPSVGSVWVFLLCVVFLIARGIELFIL